MLEGRCEKFVAGVCVRASHWHHGLLHGESVVYTDGSVSERTEYANGHAISAYADVKTEDDSTRCDAIRDLSIADSQMAAWEAECLARAAVAAAVAAAADAKSVAVAVVADVLRKASLQLEEAAVAAAAAAAAAAATTTAAAAAAEAAAVADASDAAATTAATLLEEIVALAAAAMQTAQNTDGDAA